MDEFSSTQEYLVSKVEILDVGWWMMICLGYIRIQPRN